MTPYDFWYCWYRLWWETWFEVSALRNCHNQNRSRLELIEKALRKEGIIS